MDRHASSGELKARAKGQLLGKYGTCIPAFLVTGCIMFAVNMLTSPAGNQYTVFGRIITYLILFLIQLFGGLFSAGASFLYLNNACGQKISVGNIFYAFTNHPDKAILIRLFPLLLTYAFYLPSMILMEALGMTGSYILFPFFSLAFILGMVGSVIVELMFSQAYFVMLDFPSFTAMQCLQYSKKIMKGNKARKFYLDMSFIPLYLLSFVTCCVGLIFVIPYSNATMANFYLELMNFRSKHNI